MEGHKRELHPGDGEYCHAISSEKSEDELRLAVDI